MTASPDFLADSPTLAGAAGDAPHATGLDAAGLPADLPATATFPLLAAPVPASQDAASEEASPAETASPPTAESEQAPQADCDAPTSETPPSEPATPEEPVNPAASAERDELPAPVEAATPEEPATDLVEPAADRSEPAAECVEPAAELAPPASELEIPELATDDEEPVLAELIGEPILAEEVAIDRVQLCERRIGYTFRDRTLLQNALTHASGALHRLASNERMEFLGDSVLGLVICEMLYQRFPQFLEGDLTRIKSVVVSRQTCAKLSAQLGLYDCLILGKGMATVRAVPQSLMADVLESLIAAIYLDGGFEAAADFIRRNFGPVITTSVAGEHCDNFKSMLQQLAQRKYGATPSYQLVDERGPDHDKFFKVVAKFANKEFTPAWGRNKKEAEQKAASNALAQLNNAPPPYVDE